MVRQRLAGRHKRKVVADARDSLFGGLLENGGERAKVALNARLLSDGLKLCEVCPSLCPAGGRGRCRRRSVRRHTIPLVARPSSSAIRAVHDSLVCCRLSVRGKGHWVTKRPPAGCAKVGCFVNVAV